VAAPARKRPATALAVSPDAAKLAVGYGILNGYVPDYEQVVKVFDLRSGATLATLPLVNTVAWVHFSPDGSSLFAAGHDGNVHRWRERGWEPSQRWFAGSPVVSAAVSPDGSRLATGLATGRVAVWEMPTGHELHRMPGHANVVDRATFSADGRTLVTSSGTAEYSVLKFWDVASGGELTQLSLEAQTSGIDISPMGDVLAAVGGGGLRHWDVWSLDRIDQVTAAFQSHARGASAPAPKEPDRPAQAGPRKAFHR
jgi:WD40 repeat protein